MGENDSPGSSIWAMCRGKALHLLITAFENKGSKEMEERGPDEERKGKGKQQMEMSDFGRINT